jgi:site-specific recombinase XerD
MAKRIRRAPSPQQGSPFGEAIDSFILYLAVEKGLSDNYQLSNRRSLYELAAWCRRRRLADPASIQLDDLTHYLSRLKTRGLAPASMRLAIISIRLFFDFLRRRHGLARDPAALLRTPRVKNPLPHTLNQLEMNRMISVPLTQQRYLFKYRRWPTYWYCKYRAPDGRYVVRSTKQTEKQKAWEVSESFVNPEVAAPDSTVVLGRFREFDFSGRPYPRRDRAILEVLYGCGLRATELCTLQLANVNLEDRILRVTGKGNKTRLVPIGRTACEAIRSYIEHERSRLCATTTPQKGRDYVPVPAKPRPQLFLSQRRGKTLTYVRIWQLVKELAALAGFEKDVYPHLFRHSFATHLLENDCDLMVIKELLGHADVTTTAVYCHLDMRKLKEVHRRCHPRSGAHSPIALGSSRRACPCRMTEGRPLRRASQPYWSVRQRTPSTLIPRTSANVLAPI